ncbi:major facilitator superfamily domain-containing protein [Aspergillus pseudodeflectus]|uniref:Major facilitator superfamily domain-containing protein n=1 Tax=Aspergillus pseudodeflectus TaxID=176178 RepID=A0ABR4K3Z6_9EURO
MSASQADFPACAGSVQAPSEQRDSESRNSNEREESEKFDGGFLPIKPATTTDNNQLRPSTSRPVERSWSLNDGYSCNSAVDAEAGVGGAEATGDTSPSEFVVTWDDNDAMNPRSFGTTKKWIITSILSIGSLCVTCTSSMYTVTYDQLTEEFGCSRLIATLGLSFFIWGLGLGPLVLAPLSEFYGRRKIYIISFSFFLIWLIPCAVAKNIETMIVCRFINGLAGSAFLSVAGGTVGDLFDRHDLSAPMMLYTSSPFIGPEVGPLVGGFINQYTTWRWTFYVLLIWTGALLVSIILFVPETYHPVLVLLREIAKWGTDICLGCYGAKPGDCGSRRVMIAI